MSEVGDTVQIIELVGRGAIILSRASLMAIQFFSQLCYSKMQKSLRLSYGEMSLDKLQEKQALMGDQAVFFQVKAEGKELEQVKEELSKRGIAYSQLYDFDDKDGFTQFYSIASESAKLNAYFAKHENLSAGAITLVYRHVDI